MGTAFPLQTLHWSYRMSMTHRGLAALALCAALSPLGARAEVFINEIHYDDSTASGDTGERIEVMATAGESLSGYRIYLYNGTSSTTAAWSWFSSRLGAVHPSR